MRTFLDTWCTLAAALIVALAGVFELIDQTSMIVLIVVLTVVMPRARRSCGAARSA